MTRATIFDTIKAERGGKSWEPAEVALIDGLLTRLGIAKEGRTTSDAGKALIKSFEGVVLSAYPDPATGGAPWTAGVGHTGPDVHKGMTVTQAMADAWLAVDLRKFEAGVNQLAPVTTQGQFDAMVSLAFNIGLGNFGSSTLLRKHKAADYDGAAAQFAVWNKAAGKVMPGLTRRRAAETRVYQGLAA